jgi:crossover junction endodeoxyribonuclease RuvC
VLGVAIAAGLSRYSYYRVRTKKIKMAITGNGNATKEQVVKCCCGTERIAQNLDAADGLAAAVCHFLIQEGGVKLYWLGRFC